MKMYKGLEAALSEDGNPQEVLLRELPGAVLAELDALDAAWTIPEALTEELGERGVHKYLTNRVSNSLRRSGSEANELLQRGSKLAGPASDPGLEDFELRETARQQLDALERAVRLSPQQTEVWRRLREGMEIDQIAAELGIPKKQVSVVKHQATKRFSEA